MSAKNSRQKGKNFERWAAKRLGDWWGCVFRRTPSSGGWDKLAQDGQVMASGDIIAPKESGWPCSCEMKNREGWCLESIVAGTCKDFVLWWEQCAADAKKANLEPMLVFSRAHKPVFAAMRISVLGKWLKESSEYAKNEIVLTVHCQDKEEQLVVCELEAFLAILDKERMKSVKKETV